MLKKEKFFLPFLIVISITAILQLYPVLFSPSYIFADWTFDSTPPSCAISPSSGTYNPNAAVVITVSTNEASTLTLSANSGTLTPASCTPANGTSLNCTWQAPNNPGTYILTPTVVDSAGNSGNCNNANLTVSSPSLPAYLQTTGGDVHSNW